MGDVLMRRSATGLTGSGSRDWFIQRISAVIQAVYAIVMLAWFIMHGHPTFEQWQGFMLSLPMRLFTLLMILALAGHAWVGMWTVLTDYIKSTGLRFVLQSAMIIAVIVYLFWGVMIFF